MGCGSWFSGLSRRARSDPSDGWRAFLRSAVELVLTASTETKIVLVITAVFSLVSWFIIVLKWWQFREL